MTAVRSVDSFKYGTRLFAYLFAILLVGGGLLGLGGVIIENANTSLSDGLTGIPDKTELAGGAVLALFGSFVTVAGLFGIGHKLIADSVAIGRSGVDRADPTSEPGASADADTGSGSQPAATTGPSPGEQAARDHGNGTTVPSGARANPPESPQPPAEQDEPAPPSQPAAGEPEPETQPSPTGTGDRPAEATREPTGPESPTAEPEPTPDTAADPEPASGAAASDDTAATASPTDPVDADPETQSDDPTEQPRPEPSPEEIAFGTGSAPAEGAEGTATGEDDPAEAADDGDEGLGPFERLEEASGADSAGEQSDADPLGGPTDDE